MLKRYFFILICALLLITGIFAGSASVSAQKGSSSAGQGSAPGASGVGINDVNKILPPVPEPGGMPFAGQNQNYSVVFRGNGESIVTLRVSLTNTNETSDLSEFSLRVPKVTSPKDLSAYQIIVQPPCVRYEEQAAPAIYPYNYPYNPKCVEYGEPDYYYYYGNGKYEKADIEFSGDTLKVTLPTPIKPNKTGSFFVYFRGFGYANKNVFGAYNFKFETFKVDEQINQLTVGISTDADQYLKGAKGTVDYRESDTATAMKALPSAGAGAVANPTIDRFVSQIGQGTIMKTASNLAALESYKVDGMYANSRAKLYGKELTTVLGIILFFVLLVALVLRAIQKRTFKKDEHPDEHKVTSDEGMRRVVLSAGVSFAASLVTAGYTIAIYALSGAINNVIDYQYQAVVMIFLVVISFAVYVLLLIGPAVFIGLKKGIGWGLGTFVMTIVWLILMAVVTVFVLFVFRNQPYYPPVPLVKSSPISPD